MITRYKPTAEQFFQESVSCLPVALQLCRDDRTTRALADRAVDIASEVVNSMNETLGYRDPPFLREASADVSRAGVAQGQRLAYVTSKPCGCVGYVGVDNQEMREYNSEAVAEAIREGWTVDRVPCDDIRWAGLCETHRVGGGAPGSVGP